MERSDLYFVSGNVLLWVVGVVLFKRTFPGICRESPRWNAEKGGWNDVVE